MISKFKQINKKLTRGFNQLSNPGFLVFFSSFDAFSLFSTLPSSETYNSVSSSSKIKSRFRCGRYASWQLNEVRF